MISMKICIAKLRGSGPKCRSGRRCPGVLDCPAVCMWVCDHLLLILPAKHFATAPHLSMWDNENWDTKFIFVSGSGTHIFSVFFFF